MANSYLDKTGLSLVWAKIKELVATKVDKVEGKGLSSNDYTSDEKTKLAGVASGAQANVLEGIQKNGDTVTIVNKIANISVPIATTTVPKANGTAAVGTETGFAKGDHVHPTDTTRVPTTRTVNNKALSADITLNASDVSAVPTSAVGAANGVCPLNANSIIESQYLPSFVDDIIEAYARTGATALAADWLSASSASGSALTPETGKIYILMADSGEYVANCQFRWSGTAYVKLNDGGVSPITNSEINTICV